MLQTQTASNAAPEMVTVRQAAKRGILPERTLRRLVATGKIPTVKSGKTGYINLSALMAQLNSGEGAVFQ